MPVAKHFSDTLRIPNDSIGCRTRIRIPEGEWLRIGHFLWLANNGVRFNDVLRLFAYFVLSFPAYVVIFLYVLHSAIDNSEQVNKPREI